MSQFNPVAQVAQRFAEQNLQVGAPTDNSPLWKVMAANLEEIEAARAGLHPITAPSLDSPSSGKVDLPRVAAKRIIDTPLALTRLNTSYINLLVSAYTLTNYIAKTSQAQTGQVMNETDKWFLFSRCIHPACSQKSFTLKSLANNQSSLTIAPLVGHPTTITFPTEMLTQITAHLSDHMACMDQYFTEQGVAASALDEDAILPLAHQAREQAERTNSIDDHLAAVVLFDRATATVAERKQSDPRPIALERYQLARLYAKAPPICIVIGWEEASDLVIAPMSIPGDFSDSLESRKQGWKRAAAGTPQVLFFKEGDAVQYVSDKKLSKKAEQKTGQIISIEYPAAMTNSHQLPSSITIKRSDSSIKTVTDPKKIAAITWVDEE